MSKIKQIPRHLNRIAHVELERGLNVEAREVTLSLSSEMPIQDFPGEFTILDHGTDAVMLERLNTASPLLFNHDRNMHLGKVTRAYIEDRKLYVIARFGNSELAREKFQDVQDGILTEVSVSAKIHEVKLEESESDGVDTYRATKWEPLEASLVTVPADISVGVNRTAANQPDDQYIKICNPMSEPTTPATPEPIARTEPTAKPVIEFRTDPEEIVRSQKVERERVSAIHSLANRYAVDEAVVRDHIDNDKPLEAFQGYVLMEKHNARPVSTRSTELGLSDNEKESYSVTRAIRQSMRSMEGGGKFDGLEAECSREMEKLTGREAKGFFIPTDITTHQSEKVTRDMQRNLSAGVASKGGYTVGTDLLGGSLVELLRNRSVLSSLGVRTLSGLRGDVAIPTVAGGATAYWLNEKGEATASDQAFGQIGMTPKRLVGNTAYSKQLLTQSSIGVEAFIRDDLMTALALAKDLAGIAGTGVGGQPKGIMNTTGVGSVTFGATATRAKAIEFQAAVATANASRGSLNYLTSPAVAGAWMGITSEAGTAQWLWMGNIDEGQVVGRPCQSSNQIPDNKMIYGNFNDCLFGDWDGMDVVVDPYSLKKTGQIEVTIQLLTDFAVRHAASFVVSSDAGNQ